MELLAFGNSGSPVLFFPTRMARFYDYEDWGVINALRGKIDAGAIQIYCIDSIDKESFYCKEISPTQKIKRHFEFEKYILSEVLPLIKSQNNHPDIISAGCSFGAYHAVNIAFRHPDLFKKVIGISGRYDLTVKLEFFDDLLDGYHDEDVYFHMPSKYLPNISNPHLIDSLRRLEIILIVGKEDAFLENNLFLSEQLSQKHIPNTLHLMEGEAHKPKYWGELMRKYL
jgi:esterase/lipase superfamily enzyme